MKTVLTCAHLRTQSAEFVTLTRWERTALRRLSWVARLVYEELVGLSNFKTGHIFKGSDPRVSYAMLTALLTPDQPAHGKGLPGPTLKQLRCAIDDLCEAGLVGRVAAANEAHRALFLEVPSRELARSRTANLGRGEGRPAEAKKPKKIKQLPLDIHTPRAEDRAGVTEGSTFITESAELSTCGQLLPPEPDTPPGRIEFGADAQKFVPPRGQDKRPAQAGHAPHQLSPTAPHAMAALGSLQAPPGGQNKDAPRASGREKALQTANALRRGAKKAVLNVDARDFSAGKPAGDAGAEPRKGA